MADAVSLSSLTAWTGIGVAIVIALQWFTMRDL
jgi:hypothetical protein